MWGQCQIIGDTWWKPGRGQILVTEEQIWVEKTLCSLPLPEVPQDCVHRCESDLSGRPIRRDFPSLPFKRANAKAFPVHRWLARWSSPWAITLGSGCVGVSGVNELPWFFMRWPVQKGCWSLLRFLRISVARFSIRDKPWQPGQEVAGSVLCHCYSLFLQEATFCTKYISKQCWWGSLRFYRLGSQVTNTKDLRKAPKRSHVKLIHLHTNGFPFGSFSVSLSVPFRCCGEETIWNFVALIWWLSPKLWVCDSSGFNCTGGLSYNCNIRYHLAFVLEKIAVK